MTAVSSAVKSRDCRLVIRPPIRALTADKGGLFTADRITVWTCAHFRGRHLELDHQNGDTDGHSFGIQESPLKNHP